MGISTKHFDHKAFATLRLKYPQVFSSPILYSLIEDLNADPAKRIRKHPETLEDKEKLLGYVIERFMVGDIQAAASACFYLMEVEVSKEEVHKAILHQELVPQMKLL